MKKTSSMSRNNKIRDIASYITLIILSIIWLIPIFWVVMTSFREESGSYTSYFFPKGLTLNNYVKLLTDNSQFYFLKWFGNTLFVAVFSCLISTFFVLSVSYVMSRMRFKMRKPLMNISMILGMFPGFMSMIAVYYILKGLGITQSLIALIMVYSGGAGTGFFIAKGFFDTIPKALDEAAYLDGASRAYIFWNITLPLSKPIVVYTVLTAFLSPWMDFIFASVIMGDNYNNYTVALGLFKMLEREFINDYYTQFAAGCVLISIPIAALFISLQKYYVEGVSGGAVKG
ncbi:MAG: sugar ABC transporter permease [Eubacteriales bacterium]|nr:sugar ABC transporter permease [Eubacteriales bacterium]